MKAIKRIIKRIYLHSKSTARIEIKESKNQRVQRKEVESRELEVMTERREESSICLENRGGKINKKRVKAEVQKRLSSPQGH